VSAFTCIVYGEALTPGGLTPQEEEELLLLLVAL
jgi:hypothetical protein